MRQVSDKEHQNLVQELREKQSQGLDLMKWERRVLAMAGIRDLLYETEKSCAYCKIELTVDDATLDHKVPSSKGGTDDRENLTICCYECNQLKSDKTVEEFLACDIEALKRERKERRDNNKLYRKGNKANNHINFQIVYMKGPHLC